jgi:hypothetical protein
MKFGIVLARFPPPQSRFVSAGQGGGEWAGNAARRVWFINQLKSWRLFTIGSSDTCERAFAAEAMRRVGKCERVNRESKEGICNGTIPEAIFNVFPARFDL